MKAPNARSLALTTVGLFLSVAAAAYGTSGTTQAESRPTILSGPIPGLSCGWDGNPCRLPELVVTASAKG